MTVQYTYGLKNVESEIERIVQMKTESNRKSADKLRNNPGKN
jgi:hypothetical protein